MKGLVEVAIGEWRVASGRTRGHTEGRFRGKVCDRPTGNGYSCPHRHGFDRNIDPPIRMEIRTAVRIGALAHFGRPGVGRTSQAFNPAISPS